MRRKGGGLRDTRVLGLTGLILGVLVLPAGAAAEPTLGQQAPYTAEEASVQLDQAVEALAEATAHADPTDELRDLALALPALEGAERHNAKRVLARPPDGQQTGSDIQLGAVWSSDATDDRACFDSPGGRFRVHYVTSSSDAPPPNDEAGVVGVPDYVELVAARADTSWEVQNDELNWPNPKSDGPKGDDGPGCTAGGTDIYLSDLCCAQGVLYGYAAPDPGQPNCNSPPFKCSAYLVVDNDYVESGYGYAGEPEIPLSVTTAHEYNHILQFNLAANQDDWMFESTAVWAEEKTFAGADDWIFAFMDRWALDAEIPITKPTGRRIYGTAVWNHWLELGADYGPDVILDAWESSRKTKPKDFAVAAYERAINQNDGAGFSREFGRFTAATAEWNLPNGDFPADDQGELPKVKRDGTLRRGKPRKRFELDHAAYRLLRVKPGGRNRVRLKVRAPDGVRAAIALVGLEGTSTAGTAVTERDYAHQGGKLVVRLRGARRFERITAVVANADGRIAGFGGRDWAYRSDNERFRARLR